MYMYYDTVDVHVLQYCRYDTVDVHVLQYCRRTCITLL